MSHKKISINGEIFSEEDAKISVFDRGFLYGDSVYEVTMARDGIPFEIDKHLDRLYQSAMKLDLLISQSRSEFYLAIKNLLEKFPVDSAYLRIIVTRGEGEISLDPKSAGANNVILIAQELPAYPKEWYKNGVHLIVAERLRNQASSLDPNVKSGNYLNSVMAHSEAKKLGAYDAVMLNQEGKVTESSNSNIWVVKEGILITPPLRSGLLEGLTRKGVMSLAKKHKLPFEERELTVEELYAVDECFLTSTTKRLVPVTSIDGTTFGHGKPGPITKQLMQWDKRACESEWERMKMLWNAEFRGKN